MRKRYLISRVKQASADGAVHVCLTAKTGERVEPRVHSLALRVAYMGAVTFDVPVRQLGMISSPSSAAQPSSASQTRPPGIVASAPGGLVIRPICSNTLDQSPTGQTQQERKYVHERNH
jgi:hypothetical protein